MNHIDITYEVFEAFAFTAPNSDMIKKETAVVNILLSKGADPNFTQLGVSPLVFLMSNQPIYRMHDSEIKEVKKNMLLSLLRYGMCFTVKGNDYTNVVQYAKSNGTLFLLQSIAQHTDVLNENQKKEWGKLRLKMLFL